MTRAVVYTAQAPGQRPWKIVIDLLNKEDIGINQARSEFLTYALSQGIEPTSELYTSVLRTEI